MYDFYAPDRQQRTSGTFFTCGLETGRPDECVKKSTKMYLSQIWAKTNP
jgi:hypothetical protein